MHLAAKLALQGGAEAESLGDYPQLTPEMIRLAPLYAAARWVATGGDHAFGKETAEKIAEEGRTPNAKRYSSAHKIITNVTDVREAFARE